MLVCLAEAFKEEDISGVKVLGKEEAGYGFDRDDDQRRFLASLASYLSMLVPSSS